MLRDLLATYRFTAGYLSATRRRDTFPASLNQEARYFQVIGQIEALCELIGRVEAFGLPGHAEPGTVDLDGMERALTEAGYKPHRYPGDTEEPETINVCAVNPLGYGHDYYLYAHGGIEIAEYFLDPGLLRVILPFIGPTKED